MEELVPKVEEADGAAIFEGEATTIIMMVVEHPKDCTRGTKGGAVMTSTSSLVGALPDVAAPYAESLGWDDEAITVVERPPINSPKQGRFLMACF